MGYREDLEAALARVAALESELRRHEAGQQDVARARDEGRERGHRNELARLLAERDEALFRVAALERELVVAQETIARLQREGSGDELGGHTDEWQPGHEIGGSDGELAADAPPLLSLYDHNRRWPPCNGDGAGALCPPCAERSERVEVVSGAVTSYLGGEAWEQVFCPQCGFTGWLRAGGR